MSRLRALACLAAAAGGAAFVPPPPSLLPLGPAEAVRVVVVAAAAPGSPEDGDGGGGGAGDGGGGPAGNWLANLREEADRNASGGNLPGDGDDDDGYGDGGGPGGEEEPGNVNIPSTGVSVGDALVDAQLDEYRTALEEVTGLPGVAAVRTEVLLGGSGGGSEVGAGGGGDEPARYLVALGRAATTAATTTEEAPAEFALVDVPPYSDSLAGAMRTFMGEGGVLHSILVTCRDCLHYDEAPAVYVSRRCDLGRWREAFPSASVVMYRLDVPRDCRDEVTQRLDGYGPWALDEATSEFVETGRPLTVREWDEGTRVRVMDGGEDPPDDAMGEDDDGGEDDDDERYTPEAIRSREEGRRILAVYTPGRTFGSVSYVFPDAEVCCSGYSLPIEDGRAGGGINLGLGGGGGSGAGPRLDRGGYVTNNQAGVGRQAEAAGHLVRAYGGRFRAVLPASGGATVLGGDARARREALLDVLAQYEKIGRIYDDLGII